MTNRRRKGGPAIRPKTTLTGQLFERWGASPDHDLLTLAQDVALLQNISASNLISLARAGGVRPGSGDLPDPQACASGGPRAGLQTDRQTRDARWE